MSRETVISFLGLQTESYKHGHDPCSFIHHERKKVRLPVMTGHQVLILMRARVPAYSWHQVSLLLTYIAWHGIT